MYRRNRLEEFLREYLRENLGIYFFVVLLFMVGIVFGALAVRALNGEQKAELFGYLEVFMQGMDTSLGMQTNSLLQQSLAGNLKTYGLIWVLGLVVLGLPLVLVILFTKGFALGFTVGFLVYELGWKGVVFSIASVLPPNLFLVPALIVLSVASVSFALLVIRSRFLHQRERIYPQALGYSCLALLTAGLGVVASLVEVYVSPVFMGLVSRFFL